MASNSTDARFTRRQLLRLGGTSLAAIAGTVAIRPDQAGATTDTMQYGASNDAGTDSTSLTAETAQPAFLLTNTGIGHTLGVMQTSSEADAGNGVESMISSRNAAFSALVDSSSSDATGLKVAVSGSGSAINASLTDVNSEDVGVYVEHAGSARVVYAKATNVEHSTDVIYGAHSGEGGAAVRGDALNADGASNGVLGYSNGTGSAVRANNAGPGTGVASIQAGTGKGLTVTMVNVSNTAVGALITHNGKGEGLAANLTNAANISPAIHGSHAGRAPAIQGDSAQGVGGRFTGKTGQVRLVPSSATTHPANGSAGMLFVDKSARLWFCRGGRTWVRLA